jgi:Peptidase S46
MMTTMMTTSRKFLLMTLLAVLAWTQLDGAARLRADEGQWPLTMLGKIDLREKGFELDADDIFAPGKVGLVDAICRVGGATGSFVSPRGLILTNHHVAFSGVQAASTPERDYIERGFVAKTQEQEIPAQGFTCRITEGYRDVSKEVLGVIGDDMRPADRTRAVGRKIREIVEAAEKGREGIRAEVSEMFQGKSYVLFLYRDILDVRMVCVPPRSVGEYGGETDNWVWPRHTGDFAFLRAYVGKDGKPAPFSTDNVPYRPKRHLEVNARGVGEEDFVFLLGYPGRTYRHQPAAFLRYEEKTRMPWYVDRFKSHLATMAELSSLDPAHGIKLANEMKWRANVEKNYRGKLLGMKRLDLVEAKADEDRELGAWIAADDTRAARWGGALEALENHFRVEAEEAPRNLVLGRMLRASTVMQLALDVVRNASESGKPDMERMGAYRERNAKTLAETRQRLLRDAVALADEALLVRDLQSVVKLPKALALKPVRAWIRAQTSNDSRLDVKGAVFQAMRRTKLLDRRGFEAMLETDAGGLADLEDPFVDLVQALMPAMQRVQAAGRTRRGRLDEAMGLYLDARQAWQGGDFVPDANRTLRLTWGRVRSYEPKDGMVATPFTTVAGILEKDRGEKPFDAPAELLGLIKSGKGTKFQHPKLDAIPVCMLYDCDTTGGNSGSPVMDSKGRLVGVNFDRAFEATINDYQWSPSYSRSIGVDVRYLLWITESLMGAGHLFTEMGIKQ